MHVVHVKHVLILLFRNYELNVSEFIEHRVSFDRVVCQSWTHDVLSSSETTLIFQNIFNHKHDYVILDYDIILVLHLLNIKYI